MSRERARAREARVAARQAEVAAASEARDRAARRIERRERLRISVPALPRAAARTIVIVTGVELISWLLGVSFRARLGLAVVTLAVLFVYVVSARRSPTR
ncbi:MAG: hypothetical protein ABR549_16865 [Mycobacteriales bacterium]